MSDQIYHDIPPDPGVPTVDRLRRLWAYRGWIILGGVLGVAATVLLSMLSATTFSSTADVLVRNTTETPFQGGDVLRQLSMRTEVQVGKSLSVAQRAAAILADGSTVADLQPGLRVTNPTETVVLRFAYAYADADVAAERANAFATAYLEDRRERTLRTVNLISTGLAEQETDLAGRAAALDQQIAALGADDPRQAVLDDDRAAIQKEILAVAKQKADLKALDTTPGDVVKAATPSSTKDGPGTISWVFLGGVMGIGIGAAMAWYRAARDNRVRSAEDVAIHLNAPVLAELPTRGDRSRSLLVPTNRRNESLRQAYRVLALQLAHDVPPSTEVKSRSLLIVSPRSATCGNEIAVNVAYVLAELGKKVTLVEADLRTPTLADGLPTAPVKGSAPTWPLLRRSVSGVDGLLLSPGSPVRDVEQALSSSAFQYAVSGVDDDADFVIVVAPPPLCAFDAMTVTPMVDAVLVVCEHELSTFHDLVVAADLLSSHKARLLGAVLVAPSSRQGGLFQRLLPLRPVGPRSLNLTSPTSAPSFGPPGREVYGGPSASPELRGGRIYTPSLETSSGRAAHARRVATQG